MAYDAPQYPCQSCGAGAGKPCHPDCVYSPTWLDIPGRDDKD